MAWLYSRRTYSLQKAALTTLIKINTEETKRFVVEFAKNKHGRQARKIRLFAFKIAKQKDPIALNLYISIFQDELARVPHSHIYNLSRDGETALKEIMEYQDKKVANFFAKQIAFMKIKGTYVSNIERAIKTYLDKIPSDDISQRKIIEKSLSKKINDYVEPKNFDSSNISFRKLIDMAKTFGFTDLVPEIVYKVLNFSFFDDHDIVPIIYELLHFDTPEIALFSQQFVETSFTDASQSGKLDWEQKLPIVFHFQGIKDWRSMLKEIFAAELKKLKLQGRIGFYGEPVLTEKEMKEIAKKMEEILIRT